MALPQLGIFQGCAEVLKVLRNCLFFTRPPAPLLHLHVSRTANLAAVHDIGCNHVSGGLLSLRSERLMFCSVTDWVSFLVFNIGNSIVDSVPTGTRIIIGLLQSVSVRNAGFQVIPLAAVAPALKFVAFILYVPAPEMNTRKQGCCMLS